MFNSKVTATLIICLALIMSVIIYTKKDYFFAQKAISPEISVTATVVSEPLASSDWRKTFINISSATASPIQIIASQKMEGEDDSNNITSKISKEFFALYLQDKKNGVAIDQKEASNIASKVINNLNLNSQAKKYGIDDIKTTKDTSKISKDQYAKALLAATGGKIINGLDDLGIVSGAVTNQSETELAKLDPVIKKYQDVIKKTLAITVPIDNIGKHLVYLNTLSQSLYDVQGMRKLLNDPITGYVTFTSYQKDIIKLSVVMNDMNNYFSH